jgi:hypothetical protein
VGRRLLIAGALHASLVLLQPRNDVARLAKEVLTPTEN